jgi:hypothetical protein
MIIEVFKEYDGKLRLFDAINPDYVTWMFDSENHRDGASAPPYRNESELGPTEQLPPTEYFPNEGTSNPPAFHNPSAPYSEDLEGTIYFDSEAGNYRVYSTQKNVVIDYAPPSLLSYNGSFAAFKESESGHGIWKLEMLIRDDSGVDSDVYSLYSVTTEHGRLPLVVKSRKHEGSEAPYWPAKVLETTSGVYVEVKQSPIDKTMYKISIEIDPSDPEVQEKLSRCNEYIDYLNLDFEFYDIAGNVLTGPLPKPFVKYNISESVLLKSVRRLQLGFTDTYPPSMLIDDSTIGKTTISVSNPSEAISAFGFHVKIGLRDGSVGYLSGSTSEEILQIGSETKIVTAVQNVDGIDRSGYIKAFAYLDGTIENLDCEISGETISFELDEDLSAQIRSMSYVEGDLGPFVAECEDNKRKLYVEPFVPSVLKNESIYGLCKLFERYLNTMYTPMSNDCRIGILEKIHRISEFKNPDDCEAALLPNFAEEYGSELTFNYEDVRDAASILAKYEDKDLRETKERLAESIYRRFYSILPYVDRWKGTARSIEMLYRVLGIDAELKPLWEGPTGEKVYEEQADSDYSLTSHIGISLTSEVISTSDMKKLSDFAMKAVKSILPVNRVVSDVSVYDVFRSDMSDLFLFSTLSMLDKRPREDKPEKILFAWKCKSMDNASVSTNSAFVEIPIPIFCERVEVGHSKRITSSYPIPDNSSYYFLRFREMIKRYGKATKITFSVGRDQYRSIQPTGMNITFLVDSISMRRDRLILRCQKSDGYQSSVSSYNTNIKSTEGYMAVAFKFSRAVSDYCEPITLAEYRVLSALEEPYDEEMQQ